MLLKEEVSCDGYVTKDAIIISKVTRQALSLVRNVLIHFNLFL